MITPPMVIATEPGLLAGYRARSGEGLGILLKKPTLFLLLAR